MEKQVFMKKLRRALRWTFSPEEIDDIVSDYEGFFESGKGDGKDDAQICEALGEPIAVAADLAEAMGKTFRPVSQKLIQRTSIVIIAVAILFFVNSVLHYFTSLALSGIMVNVATIAAFSLVLWFALGGMLRSPAAATTNRKLPLIAAHIVLAAINFGFFHIAMRFLLDAFEPHSPNHFTVRLLVSPFTWIAIFAVIIAVSVFALYGFYKFSHMYFSLVPHLSGVAVGALQTRIILSDLSEPYFVGAALTVNLINYIGAFALTVLAALLLSRIPSKSKGAK